MYDPDYRTSPWNRSKYAPKNSGTNKAITIEANRIGTARGLLIACALSVIAYPVGQSMSEMGGIYALLGAWFVSMLIGVSHSKKHAIRIREAEHERLSKQNDILWKSKTQPQAKRGSSNSSGAELAPLTVGQKVRRTIGGFVTWAVLWFVGAVATVGFFPESEAVFGTFCFSSVLIGLPLVMVMTFRANRKEIDTVRIESVPEPKPYIPPTTATVSNPGDEVRYQPTRGYEPPPEYFWEVDAAKSRSNGKSNAEVGREFEHEVARIINAVTKYKAIVVGGSGDGGVDIQLYAGDKLAGIVECKRYKGAVPPVYIRAFHTVKLQYGIPHAFIVTTGRFSSATREEAEALGIRLVDGKQLAKMRGKAQAASRKRRRKSYSAQGLRSMQ